MDELLQKMDEVTHLSQRLVGLEGFRETMVREGISRSLAETIKTYDENFLANKNVNMNVFTSTPSRTKLNVAIESIDWVRALTVVSLLAGLIELGRRFLKWLMEKYGSNAENRHLSDDEMELARNTIRNASINAADFDGEVPVERQNNASSETYLRRAWIQRDPMSWRNPIYSEIISHVNKGKSELDCKNALLSFKALSDRIGRDGAPIFMAMANDTEGRYFSKLLELVTGFSREEKDIAMWERSMEFILLALQHIDEVAYMCTLATERVARGQGKNEDNLARLHKEIDKLANRANMDMYTPFKMEPSQPHIDAALRPNRQGGNTRLYAMPIYTPKLKDKLQLFTDKVSKYQETSYGFWHEGNPGVDDARTHREYFKALTDDKVLKGMENILKHETRTDVNTINEVKKVAKSVDEYLEKIGKIVDEIAETEVGNNEIVYHVDKISVVTKPVDMLRASLNVIANVAKTSATLERASMKVTDRTGIALKAIVEGGKRYNAVHQQIREEIKKSIE